MDTAYSINQNSRILVSRNRPIALVVGVAGFLGSHLADELLSENIQVVGIDDFSNGDKTNLANAVKNRDFHLINDSINNNSIVQNTVFSQLPRLDYVFFAAGSENLERLYSSGLSNFLNLVKNIKNWIEKEEEIKKHIGNKPRIVFISSVRLYDAKLVEDYKELKNAEINLAKFIKNNNLNARIVRLEEVYGPRMNFRNAELIGRLINAALKKRIREEGSESDYSFRGIYVDDAVKLLVKSALSGGTAQKIYDGALFNPIKVSEIKQILLNPGWYEERGFEPTELPPWPTPNLVRTMKEMSWKPKAKLAESLKKTIAYFIDNNIEIEEVKEPVFREEGKKWSFANYEQIEKEEIKEEAENKKFEIGKKINKRGNKIKWNFGVLTIILTIFFGIIYPIASLGFGAFNVRNNLKASKIQLEQGNFEAAMQQIKFAKLSLSEAKKSLKLLEVLKRAGFLGGYVERTEQLVGLAEEGIEGIEHATVGSEALFKTTKIISGEDRSDPTEYYLTAQTELTSASQIINKVSARLSDDNLLRIFPFQVKEANRELLLRLEVYKVIVDKARAASYLLPELTAIEGKKKYLLLLQNNLELRPTGGFIGSYGVLEFERGRLVNIKVDDIYNLDGSLADVIEPPQDLKTDLGAKRWYLRDSNYDPDFPTSARQAEFFYRKEAGEQVNGVITLDLTASGELLDAVGGLELLEYGEQVDGSNLFERAISHAEVGFFPGSQAKKNYLVSLQSQLFNKIFYLSKQNWPAIISAVGKALDEKHILVYFSDPQMFSYVTSSNWSGILPRGSESKIGETRDFLAMVESNMGANKSNYYLKRDYKLETGLTKDGQIMNKLTINYKNNSPSEVFPAGIYKNRLRIYLPLGTQLTKVVFGNDDITRSVNTFSDYGRSAYSIFIPVVPGEEKALIFEYKLANPISFSGDISKYSIEVFKQPGTENDPFVWNLSVPINYRAQAPGVSDKYSQEVNISSDLSKDRTFAVNIQRR